MASSAGHHGDPLPLLTSATLTLLTDDPALAGRAQAAGVDRIGPDFEVLGKAERQRGLGYRISRHRHERLPALRAVVGPGRLFARTNPLNAGTAEEVRHLLAAGVDVLMLPMFEGPEAVAAFTGLVAGRARVVLLLERGSALRRLDEVLDVPGVDELHLGLNDLALDLGVTDRFALLDDVRVAGVAEATRAAGLPLAIGGIGRHDDTSLPSPPDLVYAALARLGATGTLLARSFVDRSRAGLTDDVAHARARLAWWRTAPEDERNRALAMLHAPTA